MSTLEWRGGPFDTDGLRQSGDGVHNVRALAYGAVGDGVADDHAAYLAAQGAVGTGGSVHFPAGTYRMASNTFMAAPVHMHSGAIIKPDNGVIVYVEGPFLGSPDKHFDVSAGGKVYFNNVQVPLLFAEWFGAKGDGVTDDTAALQAAIDSQAYNNVHAGGPVDLLNATYVFTSLNLQGSGGPGTGTWLRGAGRYATTLLTTQAGGVIISANGVGCKMTDLRLQTATSVTPLSTQYMINSVLGSACRFDRVDMVKYYNGAALNGAHMEDCILEYGLAGGIGIDLSDSVGTVLVDVMVAARYNMSACYLVQGVVNTPDTNHFIRCSTGANLVPVLYAQYGTPNTGVAGIGCSVRMAKQTGGFPPRWTRFTNCAFETTVNSIGVYAFEYSAGQDTKFTSGYILGGYYGVIMSGPTANYMNDFCITDSIIFGAYINGVNHSPADTTQAAAMTLTNCTIVDHSQNAVGGWPGVQLGPNSRGFTMRGGSCGTTQGQPVKQQFGVAIDAAAQDYVIDVDSIDFTGNTVGPTSGLIQTIASAINITPTSPTIYVSGTAAITNILAPKRIRTVKVIPTGAFTWVATGNIALAGTAVAHKLLTFQYDAVIGHWYPSYTA